MRSKQIENWLETRGVKYEYVPSIAIADMLGADKSLANVRLGLDKLDDDILIRYAIAMEEGAEFPASILFREGEKYRFIDGHHTVGAKKTLDKTHHDAYVVKTSDAQVIDMLRRTANLTLNGIGVSDAEALINGLYFIANGRSIADASRLSGISLGRLQSRVAAGEVAKALEGEGVSSNFPQSDLKTMDLVPRAYLKDIANLKREAALSGEMFHDYCRALRDAPTDAARDALLVKWREIHAGEIARAGGNFGLKPTGVHIRSMASLMARAERLMHESIKDGSMKALAKSSLKGLIESCAKTIVQLQSWKEKLEEVYRATNN